MTNTKALYSKCPKTGHPKPRFGTLAWIVLMFYLKCSRIAAELCHLIPKLGQKLPDFSHIVENQRCWVSESLTSLDFRHLVHTEGWSLLFTESQKST